MLGLRGMVSAEPFTFPPGGSPLLFQTGETYKGRPLIDRQHPHDLFMELSAQYTLALGERGGSDLTFYSTPSMLDAIYGNNPVSWKIFLRLRPARMDMSVHGLHGNMAA